MKSEKKAVPIPEQVEICTEKLRKVVAKNVTQYFTGGGFKADMKELDAEHRASIMERLAGYAIPRLRSTEVGLHTDEEETIEEKLRKLSDENTNKAQI